jgi:hypothetical protein
VEILNIPRRSGIQRKPAVHTEPLLRGNVPLAEFSPLGRCELGIAGGLHLSRPRKDSNTMFRPRWRRVRRGRKSANASRMPPG